MFVSLICHVTLCWCLHIWGAVTSSQLYGLVLVGRDLHRWEDAEELTEWVVAILICGRPSGVVSVQNGQLIAVSVWLQGSSVAKTAGVLSSGKWSFFIKAARNNSIFISHRRCHGQGDPSWCCVWLTDALAVVGALVSDALYPQSSPRAGVWSTSTHGATLAPGAGAPAHLQQH